MRICMFAVFVALAAARPEAPLGYRYSQPLLPISGNAGHGFSSGPCCQGANLLKGSGGHGGYVSGHGSSGFGQGLSAVVSSSYSASGTGGGGYVSGHGLAPAQALIASPTPVTFTGPAQGIGYSQGSSGYSGYSLQAGGSGSGSSFANLGGFGGGHFGGGGGGGQFGGALGGGSFVPSTGPGIGGNGFGGFRGPTVSPSGFISGGFSGGNFGASGIETSASIGAASIPDNSGSTLIQKHIYVHVPPPDTEEQIQTTRINQYVQPRKHYKIIFIKAPSVQAPSATQIAAANALTEEKTLVYVLVKKPEEPSVEQLQTLQSTVHHHKPEVYFIKYKAKTQPQLQGGGIGLGESFIGGGASIHSGSSGYATGGGVALTNNIGAEHNIAVVTPSPTPYAPAGGPIIEPRIPEKHIPSASYGPPPDAV